QALDNGQSGTADMIYHKYGLAEYAERDLFQGLTCYEEQRERKALAAVYWLVARRRMAQASQLLERLVAMLERFGIRNRALIARCNLVLMRVHHGDQDTAIQQLRYLVDQYGWICFSRAVYDESPGLQRLFQAAIHHHRITLPRFYAKHFGEYLAPIPSKAPAAVPARVLTDKELEIFELLGAGLSNAAISQQANIALSTAKWHLKNIYLKLGVDNRSAAVRLAHQR
ncbi:MAG: LuxR C-terminal-related transcriptional regulator, partial [Gammaproteobacteria bacterium]|nr:LuxR C-terminal-related transcriptional regulator [Gammaproteobacteria bacterium]